MKTPKTPVDFMKWLGSDIICFKRDNSAASPMEMTNINQRLISPMHIDAWQNEKKDMYFIPNQGGTKVRDIKRPSACFIDLDAGRDENGKYFSLRKVATRKKHMLKRIDQFPIKPSAVVETRNGYQVYWKINGDFSVRQWDTLQKKIAYFFKDEGVDMKVLKANQIMRLPFTTWYKTYEQGRYVPFYVKLLQFNGKAYSFNELAHVVRANPTNVTPKNINYSYKRFAKAYNIDTVNTAPANTRCGVDQMTVVADCKDFLLEIANQLPYKGMGFSAKQAKKLAQELTTAFCV